MSFDAGALIFKIQTAGVQTAQQQLKSLDQTVQGVGKASTDAKPKVDGLGTATDQAGKNAAAAKKPIDDQAAATRKAGDESAKASEKQKTQAKVTGEQIGAFKQLSVALLAAGLAVGAVVGLAVTKYASFDAQMSNVAAATMANRDQQKELGDAALKAGADTAFSANEAAAAEEELAKAGLTVSQIVGGSLNGALALAAAGQLGVARSAEIMATTLTQFGLTAEKSGHVADVLAAGAGKAQGSVDDLALALTYVGPLAKSAHWSLDETAGTLAYFATQGILGEKAGTSLRGVLAALQSPSRQAASVMEQYGLTVYDANGQMLSASQIAGNMQKAFGGLTDAERNAALGRIFGNESLTAANLLYQGGADAISKWTDEVNDSAYATEQAAMRQDNLAGDVEKLGGAFDTALIKTGSGANDVLRDMVQSVTALVDWYGELPEGVQGTALALGVGTAAALLFLGAASGLVVKFAELKTTLAAADISLGKTALVGAAAGAALAGIIIVLAHFAQKAAEAQARVDGFKGTLDQATGAMTEASRKMIIAGLQAEQGIDLLFFSINRGNAADAAEKLGVSIDTIADAAEGSADALKELSVFTKAANGDEEALQQVMDQTGLSRLDAINQIDLMITGIEQQSDAVKKAQHQQEQANKATDDGTTVTKSAADAYMEAADNAGSLESQLSKLIDQINEANGVGQDAITTNADWQKALRSVTDLVKENGKSLDQNTVSGSANAAGLAEIASKAQKAAEAQFEQDRATMSADAATNKYVATLGKQRQAFIDAAVKAGFSKDEVKKLADEIFKMPSKKEIDIIADTAGAQKAIDTYIYQNSGRQIIVKIGTSRVAQGPGGAGGITQADGGVIDFYGSGGLREHHVAQFARAGAWRVWAEPETGGEAYIPLSPAKRGTSVPVLAETANRLGFDIVPSGARQYADGGIDRPAPASADGFAIRPGTQLRLVVDGREFSAYVDDRAGSVVRGAVPSRQQVASRFGVR